LGLDCLSDFSLKELTEASVLVSRFSTVPFEAMARGVPFVYHNPHGETVPTFMNPDGGNAMSWWWYDLIDPNNLYYHFKALSQYAEGLDRRTATWSFQTGQFGSNAHVLSLVSENIIYFWMYDTNVLPWSTENRSEYPKLTGTLTLTNIENGTWVREQWNTYTGEMIHAGKFQTAMVVASEVEVNRPFFPDCLLGMAETGAAVILDRGDSGRTGFGQFGFHYDLEHFKAREAIGRYTNGKPCLRLHEAENLHELYLEAVPLALEDLLAREGLDRSQINFLLPPQISREMNRQLAERLGIDPGRVVDQARTGQDLYTASLAYSLQHLRRNGLAQPGDVGLIVQVAFGIQVGCAAYYF
jgi:hypothetical protein